MFADCIFVDGQPNTAPLSSVNLYSGANTPQMGRFAIARHGGVNAASAPTNIPAGSPLIGRNNIGFVDGHVSAVRLEDLWQQEWSQGWVPQSRP